MRKEKEIKKAQYPWIKYGVKLEDNKYTFYREYIYPNTEKREEDENMRQM